MVKFQRRRQRTGTEQISQLDPDGDDVELAHTLTVSQFAALFVAIVFEARATPGDLALSLNRPDLLLLYTSVCGPFEI
jgi:hypothetical protein